MLVVVFFSFSSSDADGQKRKKSLRRKLDSLAKEKSKDKGTPSSFETPVHRVLFFFLPPYLGFFSFVTTFCRAAEAGSGLRPGLV